jgi:hypothetical protein
MDNLNINFLKPSGSVPVPLKEDFWRDELRRYEEANKENRRRGDRQNVTAEQFSQMFDKPKVDASMLKPERVSGESMLTVYFT